MVNIAYGLRLPLYWSGWSDISVRHRHPGPIGCAQLPVGSGRPPPRQPRPDLLFRTARAPINVDASLLLGEADIPVLVFREGGQMERPVEFDRIDQTADRVG